MKTIKQLKQEIKKMPDGYTGRTNFLKEHKLRSKLETLKEVLELIDEEIKERELEINTKPKNKVAVLSRNISIAEKSRMLKIKKKITGDTYCRGSAKSEGGKS